MKQVIGNKLPANDKTRDTYWKWYDRYYEFASAQPNPLDFPCIEAFFEQERETRNLKGTTLWQGYGALNTIFQYAYARNFNTYPLLKKQLQKWSKFETKKQSKEFSHKNCHDYKTLDSSGDKLLMLRQVILTLGVFSANRGICLPKINFEMYSVDQEGDINFRHKAHQHKTGTGLDFYVPADDPGARVIKSYVEQLRIAGITSGRFLRLPVNNRWTKRFVGKNYVAAVPRKIAETLGLDEPEKYTGHAYRRTAGTIIADSGESKENLKRYGNWQSDKSAEDYIAASKRNKISTAKAISTGSVLLRDAAELKNALASHAPPAAATPSAPSASSVPAPMALTFSNCTISGLVFN